VPFKVESIEMERGPLDQHRRRDFVQSRFFVLGLLVIGLLVTFTFVFVVKSARAQPYASSADPGNLQSGSIRRVWREELADLVIAESAERAGRHRNARL
jgi:hypothetical protein